jgi:hypothetical protein
MNNSRRKFLEKGSSLAIAAGVGVASTKVATASPADKDGTRPLLDALIDGQAQINGRLYYSNELMLDVLFALIASVPGIDLAEAQAKLNEAGRYIYAIPDIDPPGCKPPPPPPPGGGG